MWACNKTATPGGIRAERLVTAVRIGAKKPAMITASNRYYFWFYGFPKPLAEEGMRLI
jgi:hypothetical protein